MLRKKQNNIYTPCLFCYIIFAKNKKENLWQNDDVSIVIAKDKSRLIEEH